MDDGNHINTTAPIRLLYQPPAPPLIPALTCSSEAEVEAPPGNRTLVAPEPDTSILAEE